MSFSSLPRFDSVPHFPVAAVKGMHLVGAFQLGQRDEIIEKQQAKRRGGPKKAKLIFSVSDQRQTDGEKLSTCELDWKTISQKNFSNRLNIQQYQRNPFAIARVGSGDMSLLVIIHGAVKNDGVVTNATGVNMDGKDLALHPRFLLSSGKGDEGAKSTFLVYAIKSYLSIQIEKVWIEHRELKVNIEGINSVQQVRAPSIQHMADIPYVQFAKKFKIVYESKTNEHVQLEAATSSSSPSYVKPKKSGKRASWVSASELAAQMKQSSTPSAAASSYASSTSSSSSSASSHLKRSHDDMLHSPPHMSNEEVEYEQYQKEDEQDVKKRMMFAAVHDELAAANFSGFEEGYNPISSPDEFPSFTFNDLSANGISDDAMMDEDGDSTPLSDASDALTPLRAITPSPATSSSASSSSDIFSQMEEAEDSLDQFDPSRVYRLKAASQQMSSMLPEPLRHATASGSQFSVVFQPYQGSPLAQPMSLDLSPIMSSAQAIPFLPALSMSPYTMSPPPLFDLDCKKQSAAAAASAPSNAAAASSTTPTASLNPSA